MMNAEELKKIMEHAKEDSCYIKVEADFSEERQNELIVVGDSTAVKLCVALIVENLANNRYGGNIAAALDDIRTILLMKEMAEAEAEK